MKRNISYVVEMPKCSTVPIPFSPQNSGDNKVIISDFLSNALKAQPAQSDFLPKICQHVTNNIVNYKTGHLAFVIRMEGLPFDGVDDKHLFTQFVSLRTCSPVWANLGQPFGGVGNACNAKRLSLTVNTSFRRPSVSSLLTSI